MSDSALVKMPHCRKSHVTVHLVWYIVVQIDTFLHNFSYLGNNPLGCQCQLVRDLDFVSKMIRSGTCSYPVSANGVKLDISSSRDPMYYQGLNATGTGTINSEVFQCSKFLLPYLTI